MVELRFADQVQHVDEPRVHRRFWTALRRAKYSAKAILQTTSEMPPDPFALFVPPGLAFNVTSAGIFLVGHISNTITSLIECTQSR